MDHKQAADGCDPEVGHAAAVGIATKQAGVHQYIRCAGRKGGLQLGAFRRLAQEQQANEGRQGSFTGKPAGEPGDVATGQPEWRGQPQCGRSGLFCVVRRGEEIAQAGYLFRRVFRPASRVQANISADR
jgi:hypothetical protein